MVDDTTVSRLTGVLTGSRGAPTLTARQHAARIAPLLSERERENLVHSALAQIAGVGALQPHLDDPEVSEVMVVGGTDVWVERHGSLHHAGTIERDEVDLCLERIVRAASRRLDLMSPVLDCVLADGSRVCAVIPPVSVAGPNISIRKFTRRILPLSAFGSESAIEVIEHLVRSRRNVLVSGPTSSGKTALISAASRRFGIDERVVCIEDTAELRFAHPHVVRLQARPATVEGTGEITLQHLVRTSLRMRPDRLVVGEVRGAEVVDMLLALSSGHDGCWSTIHSPGALDTLDRVRALVVRDAAHWSDRIIDHTIATAVDAIVHMDRTATGSRRIVSVVELTPAEGRIGTTVVYQHGTGR